MRDPVSQPSRRDFLWRYGGGLGGIALASMLSSEGLLAADEKAPPGMDYFVEVHQARIQLQDRYLLPAANRWAQVRSVTLEHIENCVTRYLPS